MKPRRSRDFGDANRHLADLLSAAAHFGTSVEDISAQFLAMRDRYNLPAKCWEYLRGYKAAIEDGWRRDAIVYLFGEGGTLFSWEDATEEQRKGIMNGSILSGHYWRHNLRPYSTRP